MVDLDDFREFASFAEYSLKSGIAYSDGVSG